MSLKCQIRRPNEAQLNARARARLSLRDCVPFEEEEHELAKERKSVNDAGLNSIKIA